MPISRHGLELLKQLEGFSSTVYLDSGGEPTIGIGHRLTRSERRSGKILLDNISIQYADGLTEEQSLALLAQDLVMVNGTVGYWVLVPLKQHQFDALVSFAFNVGNEAFAQSTLLKLLNAGQYDAVPAQPRRWVMDNGKRVPGLVNRREMEISLWVTVHV